MQYRTYEIVLRHLSGVNKGVQIEHTCKRYVWKYKDEPYMKEIMENLDNETTIMVDGGTHQDMVEIHRILEENDINHTYFIEPDLNDCMTAITVVADERVWDRENYCLSLDDYIAKYEFHGNIREWFEHVGGEKNAILIDILKDKKLSL